jgi:hypothetical protein
LPLQARVHDPRLGSLAATQREGQKQGEWGANAALALVVGATRTTLSTPKASAGRLHVRVAFVEGVATHTVGLLRIAEASIRRVAATGSTARTHLGLIFGVRSDAEMLWRDTASVVA